MIKTQRVIPGSHISSRLYWTRGGEPSGDISYAAIMDEPGSERLILTYTRDNGGEKESVRQEVRLVWTQPNYGGRRWWMICPYRGERCSKLFMPGNGDRFASRKAWGVALVLPDYETRHVSNQNGTRKKYHLSVIYRPFRVMGSRVRVMQAAPSL